MKKLAFILVSLFFVPLCFSSWAHGQDMTENTWLTGEGNTKVQTYQKDGKWYGKLVSSDNPKAPIGKDVLMGFVKKEGVWQGKVFAVKRNEVLNGVIEPHDHKLLIEVSVGFFSRVVQWNLDRQNH